MSTMVSVYNNVLIWSHLINIGTLADIYQRVEGIKGKRRWQFIYLLRSESDTMAGMIGLS